MTTVITTHSYSSLLVDCALSLSLVGTMQIDPDAMSLNVFSSHFRGKLIVEGSYAPLCPNQAFGVCAMIRISIISGDHDRTTRSREEVVVSRSFDRRPSTVR